MRHLRRLGLLGLLAIALTALFGVGSALATGFVAKNGASAPEYPANVSVSNVGSATFSAGGVAPIQCETVGGTSKLSAATKALTLNAYQAGCKKILGGSAWQWAWKTNGCQLIFHPGTETSAGHFAGTYDIGGSGCSTGIQISVINDGVCTITIPPQSGLPASFVNVGEGTKATVTLQQTGGGIHYTVVRENSFACQRATGSYEDGSWSAELSAKATDQAGSPLGLAVDAKAPTGFFAEGGLFKGEAYPVQVGGDQLKKVEFKAGAGGAPTGCTTHHFSTLISAASASFSPTSTLSGCSTIIGGSKVSSTIALNTCRFAFDAGGTLGISCTKTGDAITITHPTTGCVLTIGAQSGLSGITVTNVGSGVDRGVEITLNVAGVSYTVVKGGLLTCGVASGAHADGTFTGSLAVYGGTV